MVRYWPTRRVASTAPVTPDTLTEAQLGQWKLLGAFQRRLAPHLGRRRKTLTEEDPRRTLFAGQYVSLLLFGLLNPVLKTTRALCAASHFERMQAESQGPPVSLASFSAMQQVVEPELLAGVLREMSAEAGPGFGDDRVRQPVQELIANDGPLLPALPRMAWARWQNPQNRAGKLHLEFSVWRQVPVEFTVTDANPSERAVWQSKLRQGAGYVNDRNYSHDYKLIGDVQKAKALFVLRWHNNALFTPLESAWGLSEADRQAGVVEDINVRLGSDPDGPEGRLVRVEADLSTLYQPSGLDRRMGRADLPLPVADRTVFQVDQMRAGLSALDGRVPPGHDPPDLLRAQRLGAAGLVDRSQAHPAPVGSAAALLGRLRKLGRINPGVADRKKQIRTLAGPLRSRGLGGGALS